MDNLLTVAFEAHHVGNNHHRRYEVVIGRDLLDDWTLTVRYGRVGQVSQERRYASAGPIVVRAMIRDRLLRRLSAPKRIGCSYRLTGFNTVPGFNPADWLPVEIMARFFQSPAPHPNLIKVVDVTETQDTKTLSSSWERIGYDSIYYPKFV